MTVHVVRWVGDLVQDSGVRDVDDPEPSEPAGEGKVQPMRDHHGVRDQGGRNAFGERAVRHPVPWQVVRRLPCRDRSEALVKGGVEVEQLLGDDGSHEDDSRLRREDAQAVEAAGQGWRQCHLRQHGATCRDIHGVAGAQRDVRIGRVLDGPGHDDRGP